MKSFERLKAFFRELLASGIEVEAGSKKFLVATPEALPKLRRGEREALVVRAIRLATGRRKKAKAAAPKRAPLKVPPPKILEALEASPTGLRMQDIATRIGVAWQGLIAALRHLKRDKKVREFNGFYFLPSHPKPVVKLAEMPAAKEAKATATAKPKTKKPAVKKRVKRARGDSACAYVGCDKPHYAKGLCNNHYNIERRRKAASDDFDSDTEQTRRKAYRLTILNALRDQKGGLTLFHLGKAINEKWQTLRQPANELVREHLVAKRGKLYLPLAEDDSAEA
ncbi:MAG: hypothetical protein HY816_02735 [Candidatus Wallbacteria bacterium]|nr:hypothetical protein [Candidatus Wallbacteria bacterium]